MPESEEKTIEEIRTEEKETQEVLEEKTEGVLAKLRGDESTSDESESESTSEQSEEDQTDESQETDESTSEQSEKTEQTDESEPKEESTSEETSKKTEQTDDTSDSETDDKLELTQAEIRAAIHCKWTKEDIEELAKANPELAKKACAGFLESTNDLSKRFSDLGRVTAQVDKKSEPEIKSEPKSEPKAIDFTALEKEYENDPIVGVLKQFETRDQARETELAALRADSAKNATKVDSAQVQEDAAISQQIDTFFDRSDVTAYKDTYGAVEKGSKDWDNLTQGQIKKRYEVVEQANLILLGANQQGMEMPLDEAFERAHLLVTEDVREQTIRKNIKAKAVKRSKGLTLAPADSKKAPSTGAKTKAEIEANAARTLQKLRRS